MYKFYGTVSSNIESIEVFVDRIVENLYEYLPNEMIFNIRLVLNELLLNSASHGNQYSKDKKVKLYISICNESIKLRVEDEGVGTLSICSNNTACDLGGRGLKIVEALTDSVARLEYGIKCTIFSSFIDDRE